MKLHLSSPHCTALANSELSCKSHKDISIMAAPPITFSLSCPSPIPNIHSLKGLRHISFPSLPNFIRSSFAASSQKPGHREAAAATSSSSFEVKQDLETDVDDSMSLDNLHGFINLSVGKWNGSFYQFDGNGTLLHELNTKLSASSYGEDELISLIQTLYIKQPLSSTSISGHDDEPEWAEYKIKESNMFTIDKYQQIGLFTNERAFALRYQTAGMLETVLRQGVLGEDDTGEESPRNLRLPSLMPAVVCENCLYSEERDMRARAFHIMDPKGILEMLLVFLEERGDAVALPPKLQSDTVSADSTSRVNPFVGRWKGRSITKRSGVYGATIAESDTTVLLEMDDKGSIIQDISSTSIGSDVTTNVRWKGTMLNNLITFDGGFQITLLPGGMYMGCPSDVAKSVKQSKSFHLEFCWLETPGKRQRLVRTYDLEGLAVSSTYYSEIRI